MVFAGKLVAQTEVKASGDLFHELLTHRPHHVADMSPLVHGVTLVDGQWGTIGNTNRFEYTHAGKKEQCLTSIEAVDEEKQWVKYKIFEGDLMEKYTSNFYLSLLVEKKSEDTKWITWTCEYERLNEDVPEPFTFLEYCVDVTKHIESHHA